MITSTQAVRAGVGATGDHAMGDLILTTAGVVTTDVRLACRSLIGHGFGAAAN